MKNNNKSSKLKEPKKLNHHLEFIEVVMINDKIERLPLYDLPPGYSIRMFQPGDEQSWADIEASADVFNTQGLALAHFQNEFGKFKHEMSKRCLFAINPDGQPVGTATAWYDPSYNGQYYGRLHWVAVKKEYQRKGLGKALIYQAMREMSLLHERAYLYTQTTRWVAIKIYLDCGFKPIILEEKHNKAWRLLAEKLNHPLLLR